MILAGVSFFAAGCSTSSGATLDTDNPATAAPSALSGRLTPPDIAVGEVTVTQTSEPLPCSMSVEIRNVGTDGTATNIVATARLETAGPALRALNEVPLYGPKTLGPNTSAVYRGDFDRYFFKDQGPVRATVFVSTKETQAEPGGTGGLRC